MLDDPAYFRGEVDAMFAAGEEDYDSIKCPAKSDTQTLPEEIVLPMPCGRNMVFRRVTVGVDSVLDQERVYLGTVYETGSRMDSIVSGPVEGSISGGFSIGSGKRNPLQAPNLGALDARAYYIGKYEVTQPQYAIFSGAATDAEVSCAAHDQLTADMNESTVYPAGRVTWFDAVAFSRSYSQWLIAEDRESIKSGKSPTLPWEQGATGYMRLPTEIEWEYAARGGEARRENQADVGYLVRDPYDDSVRSGDIYEISPGDEGGSGDEPFAPAGSYLPNLLGVYDMVGNAEEIVLDAYRLVRPQQDLHGQVGGYIVKGGVPGKASLLGVGRRREVPFFTGRGELRSPTAGFRLVLTVPVMVDGQKDGQAWREGLFNQPLENALETAAARSQKVADQQVAAAAAGLQAELDKLREQSEKGQLDQDALNRNIQALQVRLEQSTATIQEKEREVLNERVKTAVLGARTVRSQSLDIFNRLNILVRNQNQLPGLRQAAGTDPKVEELLDRTLEMLDKGIVNVKQNEQLMLASLEFYFQTVLLLADQQSQELESAYGSVRNEFTRMQIASLDKYVELVSQHARRIAKDGGSLTAGARKAISAELDQFRDKREALLEELE